MYYLVGVIKDGRRLLDARPEQSSFLKVNCNSIQSS